MMKNALIVANLAGFASFLLNDMTILQDMGYNVVFAANANKLEWSDTKEKLDEKKINFVQIDFDSKNPFCKQNYIAYKQIKCLLTLKHYDLVHCHTPIAGFVTRLAANQYRKKNMHVIYTTHGFAFTSISSKKSWLFYYSLEKFFSRFCDAIITINQEDYENAKKMHCKKVYCINGVGVDTNKYHNIEINRDSYRKSIGIDKDEILVLSVGELSIRKNHRIIIEALAKVANKENYVYVICGNGINGGTGDELKKLANDTGVKLNMLGFRYDIPEITKCSDIGAIPSTREGLGLAGIQSLAAGVPVVGSDVQGIRDYIRNGENGYLCSPFKSEDFASAIEKLSCQEVRISMREKCYEIAKSFDISTSYAQMNKIYLSLLE